MVELDNKRTVLERPRIITDNKSADFVCQLSAEDQFKIRLALIDAMLQIYELNDKKFTEAVENGMCSRMYDLEETIEIVYVNRTECKEE